MKRAIAILILLIVVLSCLLYLQDEKIEVYEKIQDVDSRCIQKQDSIIRVLNDKDRLE